MEKVNNKNGIEMYYEINENWNRLEIYDSDQNYFNDFSLESLKENEIEKLKKDLETMTLHELCSVLGHKIYSKIEELAKEHDLDYKEIDPLQNEYVNVFNVGDKTFYTWCWG